MKNPFFLLVLANLFWSGNFVLSKAISTEVPPVGLAFWRWCMAFFFLSLFAWPVVKKDLAMLRQHWKILIPISLLGISCFNTLIYTGLQNTSAINSLLLQSLFPVVVAIFSFVFFREKLKHIQIAGICISLLGTLFLISKGSISMLLSATFNRGDLWICLAVVSYAGYTILLRYRPKVHPLSFLLITFFMGTVILLPVYLTESILVKPVPFTLNFVLAVLYLAILPSIMAYLFFNEAVRKIGANIAGLFSHLMPVFGSLMAILFLHEKFKYFHLMGFLLIFGGIILVVWQKYTGKRPQNEKEEKTDHKGIISS